MRVVIEGDGYFDTEKEVLIYSKHLVIFEDGDK